MSTCKDIQRQLALLSVGALDERENAPVLDHLKQCDGCRVYWERLQAVVGLYRGDAERSIVPTREPTLVRARPKQELFTWQRAVALAMSVLVLSAALVLFREDPQRPSTDISVASQSRPSSILSIADSR